MISKILIVDDELSMREFLSILLTKEGYEVDTASDGKEALKKIEINQYNLVITDVRMPNIDGIEVLKFVKEHSVDTAVIMITAFASMEQAIEAIKLGAFHYITKPFKVDEIRHVIKNAIVRKELEEENIRLRQELKARFSLDNLIGGSPQMLEIYDLIKRIAPTRTNVLITGESGTGKELAAKAIHSTSPRKDAPFMTINCGAIPENLIESELFGHKRGSFTGAIADTKGLFVASDQGTLFLDEVGELPFQTQVKLLRAIQEKKIMPIGSTNSTVVDVRIICATNRDLEEEVSKGRFREDLYYRLNVISFRMPALREHPEDIQMLADHFLEKYCNEQDKYLEKISQEVLDILIKYKYPGNVRELENIIERAIALETTGVILVESLPDKIIQSALGEKPADTYVSLPSEGMDLNKLLEDVERTLITQALNNANGVKIKAAKLLNISFRSFRYRLAKLGLEDSEE